MFAKLWKPPCSRFRVRPAVRGGGNCGHRGRSIQYCPKRSGDCSPVRATRARRSGQCLACRRTKINTYRQTEVEAWIASSVPPQAGRLAVVTSATTEQGYATAEALARAGADVVLTAASEAEGRAATAALRPLAPAALTRFEKLDPASLSSVAAFAGRMAAAGRAVDMLIHVASPVASPVAGQIGIRDGGHALPASAIAAEDWPETPVEPAGAQIPAAYLPAAYLGRFALTARLLPLLRRSRRPRVVFALHADPLRGSFRADGHEAAGSATADAQSARATLLFARELQRRSDGAGWGLLSVAVQAGTDSQGNGPRELVRRLGGAFGIGDENLAAGPAKLALFAATAPTIRGGGFYGVAGSPAGQPDGDDSVEAERLWKLSERLTGVEWPV